MSVNDVVLGMHRNITRRDFLNGVRVALAASVFNPVPALAFEDSHAGKIEADSYPPTLTGMRGDHPGSFEVAHQMRDQRGWDLSGAINTSEAYDLIVVGWRHQRTLCRSLLSPERAQRQNSDSG